MKQGVLDVGDGQRLHWEEHGNPNGVAALILHGGPGSGSSSFHRSFFDPDRYRIIQFDQRGCGRSTPHASDPSVGFEANTVGHLLRDIEALRADRGVERWIVFGMSFGTLLGLAYAQASPDRVTGLVVVGVALGNQAEIDWLYGGAGAFFPAEWERFVSVLDDSERDDVVDGYRRLLDDANPAVRVDAALRWTEWDWATASSDPQPLPPGRWSDPAFQVARARLCTHYFTGEVQEAGRQLLVPDQLERMQRVPGVIVNGRLDMQCPLASAFALHRLWSRSELRVVDNAGHSAADAGMPEVVRAAIDSFDAS